MEEAEEDDVELIEAGEDATEALESSKQPFDLIPSAIERPVITPRPGAVARRRNDGNPTEVESELAGLFAGVSAVHQQRQRLGQRAQAGQQIAPVRRIVSLAGRKRKGYRRSSIRGNQMNLGAPSAARFSDRLAAVFFTAPVPSGCTLTIVESIDTA